MKQAVIAKRQLIPTLEKISQIADKYLASEMTANEVESVMKEATAETLREFAVQRSIPIEDNEDRAGLVKIVMEDLVCEKLGVYDEEPNDGKTKWTMLNSYAEIRGTLQAIREGVKEIRKCIKLCEEQGLPSESLENVILSVKEDYRRLRREGFRLWQKLLQVMSEQEILRACEMYIAKCFEVKRRHTKR